MPVEVVNPRLQRPEEDRAVLVELERALAREREARHAAERALQQALETIRQLQTRLAHAEIARKEATAPELVPDAPKAETASRPKRQPQRRARTPAEDKPVEWWKPGWRERFRDGQR